MQNSSKTTIVLMPGLNGTAGSFQDFATIAPAAHELIAFTYPTDTALNYEELTDWVLQRLSDVEGPIVLVGESFSGPLSLFIANRLQQNVIAVILVASFIQPPKSALFKLLPWQTGFSLTRPLYALRGMLASNSTTARIIRMNSAELQKVKPAVLAHRVQQTLNVDARKALQGCHCPILYLQAAHDLIVPGSALKKILKTSPAVKVEVFSTQHFLLQSRPAEAWQAITRFLDGLLAAK